MRRPAVLVLAAVLALVAAPAPSVALPAGRPPAAPTKVEAPMQATKAVTWSVDHEAKTVTATVRLTLATSCTAATMQQMALAGPAMAARCRVSADVVKAIKADIANVWNKGSRYRCYLLQVVVDVTVDNTPADRRPAPTSDDRVVVRIDQTSAGIRSFVTVGSNDTSRWSSNDPGDRLTPTNGGEPPTTWGYPPTWEKSLYAHEAAHVMGLSDQYEDYVGADGKTYSRPKAGAPDNALANVEKTTVDQSTVDRLVERGDAFKGDPPRCDYRIDTRIDWYHFTSLKCGGPEGDWLIAVDGEYDLGGAKLALTGTGHAALARTPKTAVDKAFIGPWNAAFRIDLVGVPLSSGGQQGTISGTATLAKAVLHLKGETAKGDFWARTPALALSGGVDPLKSLDLPVTNGAFCP